MTSARSLVMSACAMLALTVGLAACGIPDLGGRDDAAGDTAGASDAGGSTDTVTLPRGVEPGQTFLTLGTATGDGPTVDVFLDFLCPYCSQFSEINGKDLQELAEDGDVTLRMHVRPMLDDQTSPAGYSGRSANAALAVYDEDPDLFWDMERALYEAQPAEGSEGLSDQQLIDLAHEVGASDAVDDEITGMTYRDWIYDQVEPEAEKIGGTPTVLIDGTLYEGDWTQSGALRSAIEKA
jgi:protein-disulfide isomerase